VLKVTAEQPILSSMTFSASRIWAFAGSVVAGALLGGYMFLPHG